MTGSLTVHISCVQGLCELICHWQYIYQYYLFQSTHMLHTIAGCGRRPDEVREVVQGPRHLREGGAAPHPRPARPRLVLQLLEVVLCRYM